MIDIHTHILPGIDDGPDNLDKALEIARKANKAGTKVMVATPHTLNGLYRNDRDEILCEVESFKIALKNSGIPLNILPGADVALTPEILPCLDSGKLMTLNDGRRYLLAEFPPHYLPEKIYALIFELQRRGITPVITHPERDQIIYRNPEILLTLVERGCISQVTAQSITGGFGKEIEKFAHFLLKHRLVHIIASDCHSPIKRGPDLNNALSVSSVILGSELAQKMVNEYPRCLIEGEKLVPLQPIPFAKRRLSRFWKRY